MLQLCVFGMNIGTSLYSIILRIHSELVCIYSKSCQTWIHLRNIHFSTERVCTGQRLEIHSTNYKHKFWWHSVHIGDWAYWVLINARWEMVGPTWGQINRWVQQKRIRLLLFLRWCGSEGSQCWILLWKLLNASRDVLSSRRESRLKISKRGPAW